MEGKARESDITRTLFWRSGVGVRLRLKGNGNGNNGNNGNEYNITIMGRSGAGLSTRFWFWVSCWREMVHLVWVGVWIQNANGNGFKVPGMGWDGMGQWLEWVKGKA